MFILDQQDNGQFKLYNLAQITYGEQHVDDRLSLFVTIDTSLHLVGTLSPAATRYIHQILMAQNARFVREES